MQNFTLGKKGISMLLLTFILLTFSFSSYAQENCPTVTDTTQEYCYLATVSDLEATANGDTVRWYRTATSTNPIPENELLQTGTYYAGNESGTCTTRTAVSVTVDDAGAPEPQFGNIFAPCVYGTSSTDVKTVQDLIDNIEGNDVEIYEEQFSGDPLPPGTPLEIGESYYAGQRNEVTNCPTSRVAIRYDPVFAPAPTAEPVQTFCEPATVADLEAQATSEFTQGFRWYSTATSQPPLASTTELIDGETYYVSQIVNREGRDEPPCESRDRFEVIVVVDETDAPEAEAEQAFCQENNPTVADLEATGENLTWYEDAALTIVANESDPLVNGEDYFVTQTIAGCESEATEVTVIVDATPGAPAAEPEQSFCQGEDPTVADLEATGENLTWYEDAALTMVANESDPLVNGEDYFVTQTNSSGCESEATEVTAISETDAPEAAAEQAFCQENNPTVANLEATGENLTWYEDAALTIVANESDPLVDGEDYFVTQTIAGCESEATEVTVIVDATPGAPAAEPEQSFCQNDGPTVADLEATGENLTWYEDAALTTVANESDPLVDGEDYFVTQTNSSGCESPATQVNVTVNDVEEANAGSFENQTYCSNDGMIDLTTLTNQDENAISGGVFSGTGVENNQFDTSIGEGTYEITYTVSETSECGENTGSTTFTITVEPAPFSGNVNDTLCVTDARLLITDPNSASAYLSGLLMGIDIEFDPGNFTPDAQAEAMRLIDFIEEPTSDSETFVFTYIDPSQTEVCEDGVITISITIEDTQEASVEPISDIEICSSDENFDLNTIIGNNSPGGTFTMDDTVITGGLLDVSEEGVFTITYTVSEDDEASCLSGSASTEFTVTVNNNTANAGSDNTATVFCRSDLEDSYTADQIEAFFRSLLSEDAQPGGTFSPDFATIANDFSNGSGLGVFSTTYTVGEGDCQDSATLSVTVSATEDAEAGSIADIVVDCEDEDVIVLNDSLLSEDATTGGTFTGEGVNEDGNFEPSSVGPGTYVITYSVDDSADCATQGTQDETTFTITVNEGVAFTGTSSIGVVCLADVATIFPDLEAGTNYLLDLLDENVSREGTFSPSVEQLLTDATGLGQFTTTYTVGEGDCQASVQLTVRIVESADAGTDGNVTLNENDAPVNLFDYLGGDPMEGGTWSPGNGIFNPETDAPGIYTYTVGTESCQDSATVTVTVTQDPTECEGIAGADNSVEVCNADVINLNENSARDIYLNLLEDGVATNGTFNPTLSDLITQYNTVSNFGDFTTTYTVVDGDCSDSVVLTVTVLEANDAGDDMNLTFCTTQGTVNLFEYLSPLATTNGTFIGYANGTFNPAAATVGETTITYEVEEDDSVCSRDNFTSTFTITVAEPQAANAGGDVAVTYCVDETETIQLSTLLGEGAITTGTFGTPFANGTFNPSTAGVGVYPITYTVAGDCITGTATATITVTVQGTAETPVAAANQSFCIVDNPTVADLDAEGEGTLTWYSDAALTTVAPATTALTNNAVFYVVSSTGDSACETSDAVMVTVTLNTEVSPTIQPEGNEFCRQDSPTVQDLIANLNGTAIRIYTSATGGTPLANTEALVDGVIYYATSTNATTGCESSERRAITVEVGFCGIPEGFSPNDDGINDRFVIPEIAENYPNYTIEVFNRWGNVVFKGNANTPDWDGVSNQSGSLGDKVLPAGVYFYIVNYNDGSTPPVQGKLYLSR